MNKDNIADIQVMAKKFARLFYINHSLTYLDVDDFAQEAVLGYLKGRNMNHAMMDAFRWAAPLPRSQIGKMEIPTFTNTDTVASSDMDADQLVLLQQILDQIRDFDPEMADILYRYYIEGETLKSIAKSYNVTSSWLIHRKRKCIELLQKRCRYDSRKYPWRHGSDLDSNKSDREA